MNEEDIQKLGEMFNHVDCSRESVNKVASFIIEQSKKGHSGQCVQVWREHQKKASKFYQLGYFYIAHECIANWQKDEQGMLKAFPDILTEVIPETFIEHTDPTLRGEIKKLVQLWLTQQLYSQDYINFLNSKIREAEEKAPGVSKANEFGVNRKIKFFVIFYRNYKESEERCNQLEKEISDMVKMPGPSASSFKEKNDAYEKALTSLKVSRRNLLKSLIDISKDFRQNMGLRLHKINELEELKARLKNVLGE